MEKKTTGGVWIVAEQKDSTVQPVSLQLAGKARKLADQLGVEAAAVLLGHRLAEGVPLLIAAGADTVYQADAEAFSLYQPELFAEMIVKAVCDYQPQILLLGSTHMGRELAPIIAARLGTGLTAHCIDLRLNTDMVLEQLIPAYGGVISIFCPEKRPQMATVAGGVFPAPELDATRKGTRVELAPATTTEVRAKIVELIRIEEDEQSLESAQFIVAGGIGTGSPEDWGRLQELSRHCKAALGCTRPVVDEGWAELETMIGQSGKMVSPQFYLGVGLSGELQHMVGIKGAQLMIAVNNDKKSPVFQQVDYGIVEDCRTFIPLLIETLQKRRGLLD